MFPPNTLLTISMITNRALMVLENNLTFSNTVNREYSDRYAVDGAKIGATLSLRKPVRFAIRSGPAMQPQSIQETYVNLTLNSQEGVDFNFTTSELMLNVDEFEDRLLKPAIATLANKIDFDGLAQAQNVANFVGTPGVTPNALLTYLNAQVQLSNNAAPLDNQRSFCINPIAEATIVDALKGLFHDGGQLEEQYLKGQMGTAAGGRWYMDQNVYVQTIGTGGGTPTVNLGGQTGASINITGASNNITGWLKFGDIVTFAGVQGVNPQSYNPWGSLQAFTVTADVSTNGSGLATIPIDPPITLTGSQKTVNASPINGAAVSFYGLTPSTTPAVSTILATTSPQNLLYHKDAFTVACVDMMVPNNVEMGARASDKQVGFSIRILRNYDIYQDGLPCRLDVLYGWQTMRKEIACRIVG